MEKPTFIAFETIDNSTRQTDVVYPNPGNQLFRMVPDHKIVFSVLDEVCNRDENNFIVDDITFKKLKYDDRIFKLYEYLRPFYHLSKRKYLDSSVSLKGLLTVLRQLCNLFCIQYVSKTVYRNGTHINTLIIYIDRHNWQTDLPEPSSSVIL